LRQLDCAREDGKAVLEIMWSYQTDGPYKGLWMIDDLMHCDPDAFHFRYTPQKPDASGYVRYRREFCFDSNRSMNGTPVPPGKFIYLLYDEERERDGRSILERLAVYDWYQRNNFIFWMVHLNRYGSPALLGKYPKGSGKKVVERLIATIRSFQQETGVVIPDDQHIEILQAQARNGGGFDMLNNIIVKIISEVIAGNAMALELGEVGSYAATQATTVNVQTILLYARAKRIDSVINRQLIPWFMHYNFPEAARFPQQQILPPRAEDIYNPVTSTNPVIMPNASIPAPQTAMSDHAFRASPSSPPSPLSDIEDDPLAPIVENAAAQSHELFERAYLKPLLAQVRAAQTPDRISQIVVAPDPDAETELIELLHRSLLEASEHAILNVEESIVSGRAGLHSRQNTIAPGSAGLHSRQNTENQLGSKTASFGRKPTAHKETQETP
jgi:hypothetical protein